MLVASFAPRSGDEVTIKTFALLQLSRDDCSKLLGVFNEIDADLSGQIDINEFLGFVDVDSTPFSRRVFSIMDEDGSGQMDFREFVVACWNYCSFEKSGLIFFTYDLYDADKNGTMSTSECKSMFVEVRMCAKEHSRNIEPNEPLNRFVLLASLVASFAHCRCTETTLRKRTRA